MKVIGLVASGLLLSVSISAHAQGFIHHHSFKTQKQNLSSQEKQNVNFSGTWVGNCGSQSQPMTLTIKQSDSTLKLIMPMISNEGNIEVIEKFPLNQINTKTNAELNTTNHWLSQGMFINSTLLSLSSFGAGFETQDNEFTGFDNSTMQITLELHDNKLILRDMLTNNENDVCTFEKRS